MKKSELRKIIKESIKELMTEQSGAGGGGWNCYMRPNVDSSPSPGSPWNPFGNCGWICESDFTNLCCSNNPSFNPSNYGGTISNVYGSSTNIPCIPCQGIGMGGQTASNVEIFNHISQYGNIPVMSTSTPYSAMADADCSTWNNCIWDPTDGGGFHQTNNNPGTGCEGYVNAGPTPPTPPTWKCAQLSGGGAIAEQVSMPVGCTEVSDGSGPYNSLQQCEASNPNIPNACGAGSGPVAKKSDPTRDRMTNLAFRGKR